MAWTGLGLYWGRVVSFIVAETTTWFLNRLITFSGQAGANRLGTSAGVKIVTEPERS